MQKWARGMKVATCKDTRGEEGTEAASNSQHRGASLEVTGEPQTNN